MKRDVGKQVPTRFDALKLAERRDRIDGEIDADRLPRLADRVVPGEGRVRWSVTGGRDERDRPALTLGLDGSLSVICQRCLRATMRSLLDWTRTNRKWFWLRRRSMR